MLDCLQLLCAQRNPIKSFYAERAQLTSISHSIVIRWRGRMEEERMQIKLFCNRGLHVSDGVLMNSVASAEEKTL